MAMSPAGLGTKNDSAGEGQYNNNNNNNNYYYYYYYY
jgi:hypothetical protein